MSELFYNELEYFAFKSVGNKVGMWESGKWEIEWESGKQLRFFGWQVTFTHTRDHGCVCSLNGHVSVKKHVLEM